MLLWLQIDIHIAIEYIIGYVLLESRCAHNRYMMIATEYVGYVELPIGPCI